MRKRVNIKKTQRKFIKNSNRVAGANLPKVRLQYRGGIRL